MAIINLTLEDSQIIYIKQEQNAGAVWKALKATHERANLSRKMYFRRKLYGAKLEEGRKMTNRIIKILETADKLKAIGEEIKDSELSTLLLCSFSPN